MKKTFLLLFLGTILFSSCKQNATEDTVTTITAKDANGFTYESVTNDPTGLRLYTLENGLKVYLSKNTDEPKIQTFIPVRAGSVYDPADNTGLAHYLEHMVFKGTDEIGTQNWEEEKVKLEMISDLYEKHKAEKDPDAKKAIYKSIDSLSLEASKISIANEYDKMVSSLGAEGTNAWTWHEETVYTNKIPTNELDKWLHLESERFSQLVLRLFHTELEAVYEEFNRGQDSDRRKVNTALNDALFPTHPYGQQTTIGISEHLKNPSMEAIHNYFNTYYVPNNMAVILVGDIEFEETIKKVNEAFGKFEYKEVIHPKRPVEEPMVKSVKKEVFGPESENMMMAYRTAGLGSEDEKYVNLVDYILANSTAGLIDLNLNQEQKVQRAGSYTQFLTDYGMHIMYGYPKSGQNLDEVKQLLLDQIELIKKGEFEDWMIDAVTNDLKLSEMRQLENASSVAYAYVDAFVHFQDWEGRVKRIDEMKKVTKQELVDFANKFYGDNYGVVYKRQGKDDNQVKVDNPGITPIELNRGKKSEFLTNFDAMEATKIEPKFIDYASAIKTSTLNNGLKYEYVKNDINDLAQLYIFFEMGKDHDRKLDLAIGFFEYVGTDTKSSEEIKKEFYKLGVNYGVYSQSDKSGIYLSGLRENIDAGLGLLEDLWANARADQSAYDKYVLKLAKEREETKSNKGAIMWNGLWEYGKFGDNSSLRDVYTIEELKAIDPNELVEMVKTLRNYKHNFFYYGKDEQDGIAAIEAKHTAPKEFMTYPEPKKYNPKDMGSNVYFVDYDMVQSEMLFMAKGDTFDPKKMAVSSLFNSYFGSGLSSIVFQEIRESKSLAYSAFSAYSGASKANDPDYVYAYVGTQANKMDQAMDAMLELMNNMPEAEENFNAAKESTLKRMAAERTNKTNIFWSHERLKKRGMTENNKKEMYEAIQNMTIEDLRNFFNENIKGSNYDLMVIGNKKDVDIKALEKFGKVKELDVDYLFNYEKPAPIKS
ncbi:insulinase family protein [Maribacter algarum]|uniref:Insulinase family protein n=1 Tax=Maribacter algarum (ex Zhang et al. 2020) TaxID=2578118 RepID=A0A5S3PU32_9FLAO|nr:M16 family metallopeptidase [Maribacter algarum]TMM57433.1 insulinase family protein [Maribacter algarum]